MNKHDWLWVAVRVLGLVFVVFAINDLAGLITAPEMPLRRIAAFLARVVVQLGMGIYLLSGAAHLMLLAGAESSGVPAGGGRPRPRRRRAEPADDSDDYDAGDA